MPAHMRKDAEGARWLAVSVRGFDGRSDSGPSCGPVRIYSPAVIGTGDLRGRQVQHEQLIQIWSPQ
jgi:hypothetical protein